MQSLAVAVVVVEPLVLGEELSYSEAEGKVVTIHPVVTRRAANAVKVDREEVSMSTLYTRSRLCGYQYCSCREGTQGVANILPAMHHHTGSWELGRGRP